MRDSKMSLRRGLKGRGDGKEKERAGIKGRNENMEKSKNEGGETDSRVGGRDVRPQRKQGRNFRYLWHVQSSVMESWFLLT